MTSEAAGLAASRLRSVKGMPAGMSGALPLQLGPAELMLLAERAVWWPERDTLFIADTHFGKEAAFRSRSIPIPDQTGDDLSRLSVLLQQTSAQRLTILGDLIHSRSGRSGRVFAQIADWRAQHESLEITLVRGNHDQSAGDPPTDWKIRCVDDPAVEQGIFLRHVPSADDLPAMAGHLHPVIQLTGPARDSVRLRCFLLQQQTLVLPAFSSFVDGKKLRTSAQDRVFAIAEGVVFEVT